ERFLLGQRFREGSLDEAPAGGEIRVTRRQRPDRVHVVRRHDKSVDFEWILAARARDRGAKRIDVIDKERSSPLRQVDGEEPASTGAKGEAIIRHDGDGIMRKHDRRRPVARSGLAKRNSAILSTAKMAGYAFG